jgi:hypothetical protein
VARGSAGGLADVAEAADGGGVAGSLVGAEGEAGRITHGGAGWKARRECARRRGTKGRGGGLVHGGTANAGGKRERTAARHTRGNADEMGSSIGW